MKEIYDFTVEAREQLGPAFFRLTLKHDGSLLPIVPGQFVEVRVDGVPQVMLRRPVSVHDVDPAAGRLRLLVQVVGHGTRRMAALMPGDRLNLVYPLGHGFSTDLPAGSKALLVGGGAGIAPLLLLSKVLKAKGVDSTILLGGRSANLIPDPEVFRPFGQLALATDDGSLGHKGLVTDHPCFADPYDQIYACGPTPMMKAVARSAAARAIPCEVSLENLMACGVGACLCCVTDTDNGHRCVCKDGPVFDIQHMKKWFSA